MVEKKFHSLWQYKISKKDLVFLAAILENLFIFYKFSTKHGIVALWTCSLQEVLHKTILNEQIPLQWIFKKPNLHSAYSIMYNFKLQEQ